MTLSSPGFRDLNPSVWDDSVQLHVLPLLWSDLGYRYTVGEVWPVLAQADLTRAPLVLSASDIHTGGRAFVVTLGEERLYGGLFSFEWSSRLRRRGAACSI